MSDRRADNIKLFITFGVVPVLSIGALYLYDAYYRNIVESEQDGRDGLQLRMRRTTSSFFLDDESEDGDPKGVESKHHRSNALPSSFKGQGGLRLQAMNEEIIGGPWTSLGLEKPLVVAMVGLPARGKSYIVKMIIRYLTWSGFECRVFNVGSYRRQVGYARADSTFFDKSNDDGNRIREEMAMKVQDIMYEWLHESTARNRVAFFDATNTTVDRRHALAIRARDEAVFLLFVESICDDDDVLERNYELKLKNEDYKGMDKEVARRDFRNRVRAYESAYETIQDDEDDGNLCYIKMINVGQKMITRNCTGYIPSQISFFLQNVHIHPRKIYLSLTSMDMASELFVSPQGDEKKKEREKNGIFYRSAREIDEVDGTSRAPDAEGYDRQLTAAGKQYSASLARFLEHQRDTLSENKEMLVLSGASRVHAETLFHLRMIFSCYATPLLNEMRGGDLHGYTRAAIRSTFPQEYQRRERDKLNYRFPGVGGESYLDVIERIRPVIVEIERQRRSVLVVCHIAVLRCIFAYLMGRPISEIPFIKFEPHHVYELTPGPFGCTCVDHDLTGEAN